MISLTDSQLQSLMTAAAVIPVEKRSLFMQRCAAIMRFRSRHDNLDEVCQLASAGLVQQRRERVSSS